MLTENEQLDLLEAAEAALYFILDDSKSPRRKHALIQELSRVIKITKTSFEGNESSNQLVNDNSQFGVGA